MQLAVFLNSDGNFDVYPLSERKKIWGGLEDQEILQDVGGIYLDETEYSSVSDELFLEFIQQHVGRGRFQIVEVNNIEESYKNWVKYSMDEAKRLYEHSQQFPVVEGKAIPNYQLGAILEPSPPLPPPNYDIAERDQLFEYYQALLKVNPEKAVEVGKQIEELMMESR